MEDVLRRMLAVEALGEEEIEKAEKKAQEIRDSVARRISDERAACETGLKSQFDAMVSKEVEAARKAAEALLASQEAELASNKEQVKSKLAGISDELLKALAFPAQER